VFHVSWLELYRSSTIPRRTHEPPPPIVVDGEQEYKVEKILDSKISHRKLQYLVHWQSYDINERFWELVENLSNVMEKMKTFTCDIQTSPRPLLVGFVVRKRGDVINTPIIYHLHHYLHQHIRLHHWLHQVLSTLPFGYVIFLYLWTSENVKNKQGYPCCINNTIHN
jgi:hypothetical protein